MIPKPLRARLGIDAGGEVEIEERDGVVEIRPRPRGVRLVEDDKGRLVLDAPSDTEALTDDEVRQIVEETRRWPRA